MINKIFLLKFLLLIYSSGCFSQTISKASLMKLRDPYGSTFAKDLISRPMPDGKTLITSYMPTYEFIYGSFDSRNDQTCNSTFICNNFVALVSEQNEIIWIKYTNGAFSDVAFDSRNNIILTGIYKSVLKTSNGDVVPLLSNNTNHYGNIFLMKLDSAGNTRWIKTTDNEAYVQAEPNVTFLRLDPDDNIYMAGHYDEYIRFDSVFRFPRISPYIGQVPFLAKLDSSGKFKWVRDWGEESGLESGLEIDSCRINMFVELGASQTHTRLRKYDFNGKWVDYKYFAGYGNFAHENVRIKDSLILFPNPYSSPQSLLLYGINGKLLKSIPNDGVALNSLTFTDSNRIYFCGECLADSCSIGNSKVQHGIVFGIMDTSGNVREIKNIQRTYYLRDNSLTKNGKVYFVSTISSYSNPYNYFSIDTITFNNLSYYDSLSGIGSGIHYRLYARFDIIERAYSDNRFCQFSPPVDTCLDREGLKKCNLITSIRSDEIMDHSIAINPNPASTTISVTIKDINTVKKYSMLIYDVAGVLKRQFLLGTGINTISVNDLPAGYYFVHFFSSDKGQKHSVKKLLISKY